jgi:hypothetical protein
MTDRDFAFVTWLDALLTERKQLSALLQYLDKSRLYANASAEASAESQICALVLNGLDLDKRSTPAAAFLVQGIIELPDRFAASYCADSLENAWRYPVPTGAGVSYAPTLRQRLIRLLAPLDRVIAEKRGVDGAL